MEPASLSVMAGKIIVTGFLLGVGFYLSKKLTNRLDEFLLTRSPEFREFQRKLKDPIEEVTI